MGTEDKFGTVLGKKGRNAHWAWRNSRLAGVRPTQAPNFVSFLSLAADSNPSVCGHGRGDHCIEPKSFRESCWDRGNPQRSWTRKRQTTWMSSVPVPKGHPSCHRQHRYLSKRSVFVKLADEEEFGTTRLQYWVVRKLSSWATLSSRALRKDAAVRETSGGSWLT